ncbi:zinc finger and SCAN domain-containing protein 5C [Oncorhynchus tshawytscha]|uniref:C2H2-type domain-containing protein n=1 Tax=Oncorhynchus tshawytscha TaxID=74940 RepID=A0AAZ3S0U0_ONCTS|nr:zinc finger and SCAN domain-containing protein 5C [Oncorhynchus tshawytscha]
MSTAFCFQAQLVSVMDALSKTAVSEISKLVDIESKVLKLEITRGRNEIAALTEKLQLMENLLWIDRGHRQHATADTRTKTPTRVRDGSMNDYCEIPQSEPKRPAIKKSESSWENICPPEEMHVIHLVEDSALVLETVPTTVVRDQPKLIVIKEEPSEVDIWGSGPKTELINEKEAATSLDTDVGCLDVHQHCPDGSDKHPMLTESQVNHSTPPSSRVQLEDLDTHWMPPACPQSQDAQQLTPAAQRNSITGNSSGGIINVPFQSFSVAKSNMKIHSLRTSGAKRFGCMQCGKNFRCYSQLEIHQRSHTGEKPYRCTLCGKRYAQKGHLYTHQRTHTGEKPYRCLDCGKSFIQKCTLDMHQRTHTGEKPYVCVKCGKGFTKNCNLKKHMGVHTEFSMHVYSESSFQEDRW